MRFTLPILALGILASGPAVRPVNAANDSASISVIATAQASCLVSVTAAAFRTYPAAADAASTVSVACSNSVPCNVSLNAGVAHGAPVAIRPMTGSVVTPLDYALHTDLRSILNWREGITTDAATGFGSGSTPELAILGRLSAARFASPAADADTIIVVVTF